MTDEKHENTPADAPSKPGRRGFIAQTGLAIGGGVVAAQLIGCGNEAPAADPNATPSTGPGETPSAAGEGHLSTTVEPGQLDDYYGFWSGGQSGEVRVLGIPSMRELKRIPVFNRDSSTGWGADDWSKQLLKGRQSGDTHHVHLSYHDGTYDGRYAFVNDKSQARLARMRLDVMEVDAIVDIPNSFGTHGIFPQRHHTGLVFCNSEFRAPLPNDGHDMDDKTKYSALHTAIDGETMQVKWQVQIEGNLDLAAADYEGKYSFACCYNSEGGVTLEEMMGADRDYLYVFNLENIQNAVTQGHTTTIGDSPAPVVDARGDNGPFVLRIPIPKSPHGVNISPDGRYAICSASSRPPTP